MPRPFSMATVASNSASEPSQPVQAHHGQGVAVAGIGEQLLQPGPVHGAAGAHTRAAPACVSRSSCPATSWSPSP